MAESNAPLIGKEDGDECADREHRETADDYPSIARSGRWRIIRCRDDIQWIVQRDERRGPAGRAARPWRGVAYVASQRFLREVISRPSLGIPRDDLAALLILAAPPVHIKTGAAVARVTGRAMA